MDSRAKAKIWIRILLSILKEEVEQQYHLAALFLLFLSFELYLFRLQNESTIQFILIDSQSGSNMSDGSIMSQAHKLGF